MTENIFKKFKDGIINNINKLLTRFFQSNTIFNLILVLGKLTVIGWGTQNKALDGKPKVISWKEQEVENNLVSRENCNRFFSRITGKLAYTQICAGGYPGRGTR